MQTLQKVTSAWRRLRSREINCDEALQNLVDEEGTVDLSQLDEEVSDRFFRSFPDRAGIPPVLPLLLWQNCYYIGSPAEITEETVRQLARRTRASIKVIPITEKSYSSWYHSENFDPDSINASRLVNPLTGEEEAENISETTELHLSKAEGQIDRIKALISGALRSRASDIHLEPIPEGLRIRYRIDGVLRDITNLPPDVGRRVIVALKVMSSINIAESRRPQDGRIAQQYTSGEEENLGMDMRVSTLPCVGGEKAVIRLLPRKNPFSTVDNLGFSEKTLPIYKSWMQQPQGMIIFTGPTGSGKTSTLYTSLQAIATEHVNVVTVEDPVEYVLPRITQTQVHEAAGMTFAAGLRAILRQDPDIVMVGEIRDHETAETAVRAALTGHLVFTTLHTNDAAGAIPRIKDIGPDPGLISEALLGIVAQRLVRRVCPNCAESYTPTDEELLCLGLTPDQVDLSHCRRGTGCVKCFQTGYFGREAVVELLEIDETVRDIIYEGTMSQLHRHLSESGFNSFRLAAIDKLVRGVTTVEELLRALPRSALCRRSPG